MHNLIETIENLNFRTLFDAIADAMLLTANAGHIVFANPAAQQLKIEQAGIRVQSFENVKSFLNAYRADFSSCIIIDVKMSGMGGLQLQEEVTMV